MPHSDRIALTKADLMQTVGPDGLNESDYPYPDWVRQDILRMIPPDGQVIGSIGCGRAMSEAELVKKGRTVHGVDVSAEALAVARQRITTTRLARPEERVFFEDRSLDGLILADVIEHLPLAWDALRTYCQAVRPGGWVVISVPNMLNLRSVQTFILHRDWPEETTGIFDETHLQVMTYKRLKRWGEHCGLKHEKWFDFYLSGGRFARALQAFNACTFRVFNDFLHFEIQGRFRKV